MKNRKIRNWIFGSIFAILVISYVILGISCSIINPEMNIGQKDTLSQETKDYINEIYADINGIPRDYHIHVVGIKECGNGNFVNPEMQSWFHPIKCIKFQAYRNASGITDLECADKEYIKRLLRLTEIIPSQGKYHLLAFDKFYTPEGNVNLDKTEFFTSNDYVYSLYEKNPDKIEVVVSINPYRKDALEELKKWADKGVKYVKWLPNAMGIDPSDKSLVPFYKKLVEYDMVLLTHTGREDAVDGEEYQQLGNPLLLRTPLNLGVKVIMAHCASTGKDKDLDDSEEKEIDSFQLFLRMMDDKKYSGLLFSDISAVTQFNRKPEVLKTLLDRQDLHPRLVNGSDYPLPAINLMIQTKYLVKHGFITPEEREILNEIYKYNPLMFDYAVKRTVKHPETGQKFSKEIFTRDLFCQKK